VKLLVLGGTKFLGRAIVEAALAGGQEVSIFTRGQTNPDLFPEAEHLVGDRDGALEVLSGRSWDSIVDTSGFVPRVVRQSVELVHAPYYLFVSSRSVYADLSGSTDEDVPTHGDVESEEVDRHYGELKAMCERVARGRPGSIVRPGLIVGPHDSSGRFTWWAHRLARGGEVIAPGAPSDPVTLIDVRDLGGWLVELAENRTQGVFNAIQTLTWGELLEAGAAATGSAARLVWIPSDWLLEAGVGEWMELPLWVAAPEVVGMHRVDNRRAVAAGLTFRPLDDVFRTLLAEPPAPDGVGLAPEREAELLRTWRPHPAV
jgi:2'-hydroxyisoflavone reductase